MKHEVDEEVLRVALEALIVAAECLDLPEGDAIDWAHDADWRFLDGSYAEAAQAIDAIINEDGPRDVESGDGGTESSPSYRSAMNDAGRGHLLP